MPFDARTLNWPRSPTIAWVSSVHTPVALTTCFAADLEVLAGLEVVRLHADDALADLEEALDLHAAGDVGAVEARRCAPRFAT